MSDQDRRTSERQRDTDAQTESQPVHHSPIEDEFAENEGDTPAPRDGYTIAGYSISIIIAAIFILFLIATVVAIAVA